MYDDRFQHNTCHNTDVRGRGYSPEPNPDARLNADRKHAIGSKVSARTKAKLRAAATDHMARIEAAPDRVKPLFQDLRVKYAA